MVLWVGLIQLSRSYSDSFMNFACHMVWGCAHGRGSKCLKIPQHSTAKMAHTHCKLLILLWPGKSSLAVEWSMYKWSVQVAWTPQSIGMLSERNHSRDLAGNCIDSSVAFLSTHAACNFLVSSFPLLSPISFTRAFYATVFSVVSTPAISTRYALTQRSRDIDLTCRGKIDKGGKDNMCRGGKLLLFCDSLLKSTVKIG